MCIKLSYVKDIRTRYGNRESKRKVYNDYKNIISLSGFNKIWQGITWKEIMPEVYTKENKNFHRHNFTFASGNNPHAKLTLEMVEDIKNKIDNGINVYLIYKDYETLFNKNYFLYQIYDKIKNGEY